MLIAQRPSLSEEAVSDSRSRFTIEPLEPGFGYTLGNSLRRTLLSSIPGAAVTSIKIDGNLHEFSTIEGVVEDVTEVILNLKVLVVSSEEDEPVTMYLRKAGAGEVTAADIAPPAGVEVHNPDLHVATLNDNGRLEMELVVERGRGYVPQCRTRLQTQRSPDPSIHLFTGTQGHLQGRGHPRRAAHRLRQADLDVETKQAIRPRDAVASAGRTLVELFGLARELNVEVEGIEIGPRRRRAAGCGSALPVEDLNLTVRSYTASSARASTPCRSWCRGASRIC
jgi:DNA-directed RNA polymerase subunit alpha